MIVPNDFHGIYNRAVVRGGALGPLEFGVSEKMTERVYYYITAPPDLKT